MSPNVSTSPRDKQSWNYILRSGLAGGIAGCVAKTIVAPLDRVKILFQASNPDFRKYAGEIVFYRSYHPLLQCSKGSWSGAFRAGAEIYHDAGLRGLFQGHSATLLRIFPYASIKFMAYDQVHNILMPTREQETNARRFLAGAISGSEPIECQFKRVAKCVFSGTLSVFVTYPLDVIRVRMAFQTKSPSHRGNSAPPTFTQASKQIYNEHTIRALSSPTVHAGQYLERFPILKFYRGFSVTVVGMIPYAGVSFLCWGFLRSRLLPPNKAGHKPPTPVADLAIGAVSGLIAQTASYPFEIVRRRMQVGGITRPDRWLRPGETISAIWHSDGWFVDFHTQDICLPAGNRNSPLPSSALRTSGMQSNQKVSESGKEKKTRRRLRLSCVECTKRRQRGVTHLCRWETVPLARPTPARPPGGSTHPSSERTIETLLARIASLESALSEKGGQHTLLPAKIEPSPDSLFPTSPSGSSTLGASTDNTSPYASPGPDNLPMQSSPSSDQYEEKDLEPLSGPLNYLQPMMYNTTSTLARLSVGHHGEYIGRGSLICALHAISTGTTSRFLYAKSTDSTSAYRNIDPGVMSNSLIARVEDLIRDIPSKSLTTVLLEAFFTESNWRFGIPEEWFRAACAQMWNILEYPGPHGIQINANWLSLFFAVLAYAPTLHTDPREHDTRDQYFSCALMARRIAEDDYMNKPNISLMVSAADGTVLSCLAVPLLCSYLSQRGRVSEAWKLVGNGIRNAEAVGMHRDPEWRQWQVMSKDEVLLRRRAWWGLYIWDKMYSYLLGRPQMLRKEVFDVAAPSPIEPDGTRNLFNTGQIVLIQLSALAGAALENCFSVSYPDFQVFFEMDSRFEHWEKNLPSDYQLPRYEGTTSDLTTAELSIINRQRYTLHTWYLLCRVKLHIAALTGVRRLQQLRTDVLESSKTAILMSMRLIKLQCEAHDSALRYRAEDGDPESVFPGSIWFFEGCFSLFEATVALITTLTRYPWKDKIREAEQLVDRAIDVLTQVAGMEKGEQREIASMAAEALGSLRQESWWQAQISGAPACNTLAPPFQSAELATALSDLGTQSNVGYDQWFASMTYSNLFGNHVVDISNDV
ncbi:hypothetical protein DXG01_004902 [Tephrocybe rancida]|nr:hypothetical protein DXG01_004902 [Tephrocybe rancida]